MRIETKSLKLNHDTKQLIKPYKAQYTSAIRCNTGGGDSEAAQNLVRSLEVRRPSIILLRDLIISGNSTSYFKQELGTTDVSIRPQVIFYF